MVGPNNGQSLLSLPLERRELEAQARIKRALASGPRTHKQLLNETNLSRAALSRNLQILEELGTIAKTRHSGDRRLVSYSFTDLSKDMERTMEGLGNFEAKYLELIPDSPKEVVEGFSVTGAAALLTFMRLALQYRIKETELRRFMDEAYLPRIDATSRKVYHMLIQDRDAAIKSIDEQLKPYYDHMKDMSS